MLNPNPSPFSKDTTTNLAYIAHQVHPPMQREKQASHFNLLSELLVLPTNACYQQGWLKEEVKIPVKECKMNALKMFHDKAVKH